MGEVLVLEGYFSGTAAIQWIMMNLVSETDAGKQKSLKDMKIIEGLVTPQVYIGNTEKYYKVVGRSC